jgi:hypothetical protein
LQLARYIGVSPDVLMEGIAWNPGAMDIGRFKIRDGVEANE